MQNESFGKIHVIRGGNQGRFPFCNSLFIDDSTKAVIDPGAGMEALSGIKDHHRVDLVINTHYHFDHIAYNHIFSKSMIYLNDVEAVCFRDRADIARRLGLNDIYGNGWTEDWLSRISDPSTPQTPYSPQNRHEWWLSTARIDGTYGWGDVLDIGQTKMKIIGAPGHSEGFCCLHFPEEGVVYTGDIDLTAFGPWYFGADGDIEMFIRSAAVLSALDADTFVTGHEVGILSRQEFLTGLDAFMAVIDKRDRRILAAMDSPLSVVALADRGLIYGSKFHVDSWVRAWEEIAIKKHLARLIDQGRIKEDKGLYRRVG